MKIGRISAYSPPRGSIVRPPACGSVGIVTEIFDFLYEGVEDALGRKSMPFVTPYCQDTPRTRIELLPGSSCSGRKVPDHSTQCQWNVGWNLVELLAQIGFRFYHAGQRSFRKVLLLLASTARIAPPRRLRLGLS